MGWVARWLALIACLLAYQTNATIAYCQNPTRPKASLQSRNLRTPASQKQRNVQKTLRDKSQPGPSPKAPDTVSFASAQASTIESPISPVSATRLAAVIDGTYPIPDTVSETSSENIENTIPGQVSSVVNEYPQYVRGVPSQYTPRQYFGSGEYLMYWTKAADLPVLASTGALDQATSTRLLGGDPVNLPMHNGMRWNLGVWDSPLQNYAIQGSYLGLESNSRRFFADNQTSPNLAQPFFNVLSSQEDAAILAAPSIQTGSLQINIGNQLQMADALLRWNLERTARQRLDFILGYQFAQMTETLSSVGSTTYIDPNGLNAIGTVIASSDFFRAKNNFHGGEIGLISSSRSGPWNMELSAKLAVGNNQSQVRIDGSTVTSVPQATSVTDVGGIFALPSNINNSTNNSFAVLPQVSAKLSRNITRNLSVSVGYNFIYWNRIVRPGQLVDRQVNPSQFPPGPITGTVAPIYHFATTDFWVQGISFGCQYRY